MVDWGKAVMVAALGHLLGSPNVPRRYNVPSYDRRTLKCGV